MGITQIVELEMAFNLVDWKRRVQSGTDCLRVRCGMYEAHLPAAIEGGHKSGDVLPGTAGLVEVGPFKARLLLSQFSIPETDLPDPQVITDGSLGSRTACCHHAYPGEVRSLPSTSPLPSISSISSLYSLLSSPSPLTHPSRQPDNFGRFEYPVPTLKSMLETATAASFNLAVHALGDKAISLSLECISTLSRPHLPNSSIEHAQLLAFDNNDVALFKQLGLIASIQPLHMSDDIELSDRYFAGRTQRAFAFKHMVDAGIPLRMGSDAPVAVVDPYAS